MQSDNLQINGFFFPRFHTCKHLELFQWPLIIGFFRNFALSVYFLYITVSKDQRCARSENIADDELIVTAKVHCRGLFVSSNFGRL